MTHGSHNTLPLITYEAVRYQWFIHNSTAYNVEAAPASIFRAAIRAAMDLKQLSAIGSLQETLDILNSNLDLFAKWWLLCYAALQHTDKPMKLYASRAVAEQVIATTR